MGTVSWIHAREERGAPVAGTGYRLWFNRDERRERGPERPAARETLGGTAVLAPADGDFGGTWLALNEFGLCLGLLNGDEELEPGMDQEQQSTRSRGLLVRSLAHLPTVEDVLEELGRAPLVDYRPFLMVALEPGRQATILRWNGRTLDLDRAADRLRPLLSSGIPGATRARAELYERLRSRGRAGIERGTVDPERMEEFHRTHLEAGHGPCVHGAEVQTRSMCHVRVEASGAALTHVPGPPCRTPGSPTLHLPLRPIPSRRT